MRFAAVRFETTDSSPAVGAEATTVSDSMDLSRTLLFFPASATVENTERKFRRLKEEWKDATQFMSSTTGITSVDPYLQIVALGPDALPIILEELKMAPDHWFQALRAITGEDPVEPEYWGDLRAMSEAWLAWGRQRGFVE